MHFSTDTFIKYFTRIIIYLLIICIFIGLGTAVGYYIQVNKYLPSILDIETYNPSLITKVYSLNGEVIAQFCLEKRIIVPYSSFPPYLIPAFIAIEDANFFKHKGIDWEGIMRALIKNIKEMRFMEGGSTITQQLTRSILLHREKTIIRKLKEIILSLELEKRCSKEQILELYLNQIYLGHGAYGVEAASLAYFSKHVENLDLAECALLASLPKAPNTYSPIHHYDSALNRRNLVLKKMMEKGYISHDVYNKEKEAPIVLHLRKQEENRAPYFVEYVRQYLLKEYGSNKLYRGGLKVFTSIDLEFQEIAEKAVQKGLMTLDKRQGFRPVAQWQDFDISTIDPNSQKKTITSYLDSKENAPDTLLFGHVSKIEDENIFVAINQYEGMIPPAEYKWTKEENISHIIKEQDLVCVKIKGITHTIEEKTLLSLALEQIPVVQGALVAIDLDTGYVKTMVGGFDFEKSKFNRAVQAERQVGSAFKPFIYATALKQGGTLADIIIDSPIIGKNEEEEKDWKPRNYHEKFYGPTTLRKGLEKSRNVVTVKLLKKVGLEETIETATQVGLKSTLSPDLSLALGSAGVSLLNLTSAYGVFARQGIFTHPLSIIRIEEADGSILEENEPVSKKVMDEKVSYLMCNLLQGVVNHGTGWRAKYLSFPVGGKTGTSNNYIDAWFIGFSPRLATGVWVGFDEFRTLGDNETGSSAACPIWVDFMENALEDKPIDYFSVPKGIKFVSIDPDTGLLATPSCPRIFMEVFREGNEPKRMCDGHKGGVDAEDLINLDMDVDLMERATPQIPTSENKIMEFVSD
ncbi:MAG: penicillin-binding protein 1A [bacterium]